MPGRSDRGSRCVSMQALYEVGVAAGKKATAFGDALPELSMRGSSSQQ